MTVEQPKTIQRMAIGTILRKGLIATVLGVAANSLLYLIGSTFTFPSVSGRHARQPGVFSAIKVMYVTNRS